MHKLCIMCAKTVHRICTTCGRICGLYTQAAVGGEQHVGNNSNKPTAKTQFFPQLSTGLWAKSTAVIRVVIHRIHMPNKDNHKLVLHKLFNFYYVTRGQTGASL